jgi:cardiolipin synthase
MTLSSDLETLIIVVHIAIIGALSLRVIMKRRPVGVSLAWLVLIFILPLGGALFYLFIGERRLGKHRAARAAAVLKPYKKWHQGLPQENRVDWSTLSPPAVPINRLAETVIGIPALAGNQLQLIDTAAPILQSIIEDIDHAQHTCFMEFYIWNQGGIADEVGEALIRAAGRGVTCRVLVDAVGSAGFLKSQFPTRFRKSGIELAAALPVGPLRAAFVRLDLRLHRKIVVIDGKVAYTGSLNLVDPRFFKQEADVGQWIDAMVRIEGPAVEVLRVIFLWDWEIETGAGIETLEHSSSLKTPSRSGTAVVQVVPSGPGYENDAIHRLLLTTVYAARRELIMTTPYFVPDEAVQTALLSAAQQGVKVTIILPEKIDSVLVRYACRSYFDDLLAAGVKILRFQGGLLHTKSITVDGQLALFGTVNLDMRSFWLDFEVTLCIFDSDFGDRLRTLQLQYAADAQAMDLQSWRSRTGWERFCENAAQLFAPLL